MAPCSWLCVSRGAAGKRAELQPGRAGTGRGLFLLPLALEDLGLGPSPS